MPRRNRVTPFAAIEATDARGTLMGNRGILHDAEGRLGASLWRTQSWICCRLQFRGRHREVMRPGSWTELFFLDEAVALAAGHRPCAECRRAEFDRFRAAWTAAQAPMTAADVRAPLIDRALHAARLSPGRRQRRFASTVGELPDGVFVVLPNEPLSAWLLLGGRLHRWSHRGYGEARAAAGRERVEVLTPAPSVSVLAAGYRPALHPSLLPPPVSHAAG